MKRALVFVLLLLTMASIGLAQRAFQLRVSVPNPSLGLGLEAGLQRDLVALIYGDVVFSGPRFLVGGEVLFKPDLGQFDRDLRGIKPYFGGGLGLNLPSAEFALTLSAGVEFALDRDTGLFVGGQSLFPFNGSSYGRLLFGAVLR
ncbi:MAG: hypothetical protein NZ849_04460 [Meiothermus sp.]|uniref:hypothetical protein n=1 Tax=Meiothermus sp. TaxID=1955249 RepID=UPI0025F88555|nr:hypothetical protein [Meiothermus sp.]MCS7057453.1 hypothetical protein [Meiothermus sp.]MCS7194151.1 hypothetical protein [Meiothermus sp.]MCX7740002.1 hypothetical protein [Meiothermus sp.]MDW8091592.1 hypothetical protein [Meiothermus sp.]MDW8481538.1 hypothetical protein [Meiothermus sp.]